MNARRSVHNYESVMLHCNWSTSSMLLFLLVFRSYVMCRHAAAAEGKVTCVYLVHTLIYPNLRIFQTPQQRQVIFYFSERETVISWNILIFLLLDTRVKVMIIVFSPTQPRYTSAPVSVPIQSHFVSSTVANSKFALCLEQEVKCQVCLSCYLHLARVRYFQLPHLI